MSKLFALACLGWMAVGSAAAQDTSGLPDGPGKQLVLRMCTACHGSDQFITLRDTPEGWAASVQLMVSRGAEGTDAEIALVTKYLSTSFPYVPPQPAAPATASPTPPKSPAPAAPPASHIDTHKAVRPVLNASVASQQNAAELRRYLQPMTR
jgi:hypothetical protein